MSEVSEKLEEIQNEEVEEIKEVELSEIEIIARDSGYDPDKTDKDGNHLSPEEFMARKPLFNKIRNQGEELTDLRSMVDELRKDSKKIIQAGITEKESLLDQLKAAREGHLDNLDVDKVKELDKQIESVSEAITETKTDTEAKVSPHYAGFLKDNDWADDDDHPLSIAAEGMARRYLAKNPNAGDQKMYDYIHDQVRKDFPEKFETKKPVKKVGSARNRSTSSKQKTTVSLADLPSEERRIVEVMMDRTGKTEEEYMKNYIL